MLRCFIMGMLWEDKFCTCAFLLLEFQYSCLSSITTSESGVLDSYCPVFLCFPWEGKCVVNYTYSIYSFLTLMIFVSCRIFFIEFSLFVLGQIQHVSCELELFRASLLAQIKQRPATSPWKGDSGQIHSLKQLLMHKAGTTGPSVGKPKEGRSICLSICCKISYHELQNNPESQHTCSQSVFRRIVSCFWDMWPGRAASAASVHSSNSCESTEGDKWCPDGLGASWVL